MKNTKRTLFAILMVFHVCACESETEEPPIEPEVAEASQAAEEPSGEKGLSSWEGTSADAFLKKVDASIAHHTKRFEAREGEWLHGQKIADQYMARARLTGSLEEYVAAETALKKSVEQAPEGSGPIMSLASLNFAVHRFDEIPALLEKIEKRSIVKSFEKAEIAAMRGDLATHRGELAEAQKLYEEALELDSSSGHMVRMGHLERYRGNLESAEKWMERAIEASVKETDFQRAWTQLQAGLIELEQGEYDDAMKHYEKADELFGGWYLILEHIAEIHAIRGDLDKAEAMYREILENAPNPEFMDALAGVLEEQGKPDESEEWRKKAAAAYEKQIEIFPKAAYGHALDHFLDTDKARALELAVKNFEARPGPPAAVAHATALMAMGEHKKALEVVQSIEKTGWSTADYHAVAYWVKVRNEVDSADSHRKRAVQLHPEIVDDYAWMKE